MLKDYFIFGQLLGKGSFATVFKVTDRHTNKDFAMKIIEKGKSDDCLKQVFKEVFILKKIKHQNVIRLYECYEAKDRIYMQME